MAMSHPADAAPNAGSSWEGDRMFNIYIYDYCNKRGFRKTAHELLSEADIPPDSHPPINAKQGLLFEWWSVFWVLFTAKSNGTGTEDAMTYTQHQMQQNSFRQGARSLPQASQVGRILNGSPAFAIHPNGVPGSAPPGPNPASQNFTSLMPGQPRPAPQHRPPNGVNPYQSPTIAHSPQNPGQNPGPNPQNPMNQLGPSPHMPHIGRNPMLPPNPAPPTQTPPFAQLARSSSRPASPAQIIQASPSMIDRQTASLQDSSLSQELVRIPTHILTAVKQELGLPDKELQAFTLQEKTRVVNLARERNPAIRKAGPPGPQGSASSSHLAAAMLPGQRHPGQPQPPQLTPQQQPPQQSQQPPNQPPQQQRVVKRNSTSPGEEHGQLPNSDNSPPDRKRLRRSSVSMDQVPPAGYPPHQQQQQPQPPQQQPPQQIMNGALMRPGPGPGPGPIPGGPMNNFPPHGPPNPPMGIPMGAPQMPGNAMSPGMGGPRPPNMMQYHQGIHAATKGLAMANGHLPGGGAGTPTPGEPPFNPGPGQPPFPGPQNNRLAQNKAMGMMPPPSPAGGPPKEQAKDVNKPPGPNGAEGSPRNQQPPNAASGAQPNPNGGAQVSTAPPTPSATGSSITVPSPSAVVNGTPTINSATQPTTTLPEMPPSFLTPEFMQSVAGSLDEFDTHNLLDTTGINFEQDFREWFNPDDLDMK